MMFWQTRAGRTLVTFAAAAALVAPAAAQNRLFGGVRPGGGSGMIGGVRPGVSTPTRGIRTFSEHPRYDPRNFDASWRPAPASSARHDFRRGFDRPFGRGFHRRDRFDRDDLRDRFRHDFDGDFRRDFHDRIDGRFGFDSGLHLKGHWKDDDWKLKLHLGDPFFHFKDGHFDGRHFFRHHFKNQAGFFIGRRSGDEAFFFGVHGPAKRRHVIFGSPYVFAGYPYGRSPYYHDYYDTQPISYPTASVDPRLAYQYGYEDAMEDIAREPQTREQLEPLQRARIMLASGDAAEAVRSYREHLEGGLEAAVLRELAVALLEAGRVTDGIAMMRLAYEQDPTLAGRPIDPRLLGTNGGQRLRALVRNVAPVANDLDSSSGWLAEAVLMQAEGRDTHARRMLRQAIGAGLEDRIAAPLAAQLGLKVRAFDAMG